jgi:hypothetical protein
MGRATAGEHCVGAQQDRPALAHEVVSDEQQTQAVRNILRRPPTQSDPWVQQFHLRLQFRQTAEVRVLLAELSVGVPRHRQYGDAPVIRQPVPQEALQPRRLPVRRQSWQVVLERDDERPSDRTGTAFNV